MIPNPDNEPRRLIRHKPVNPIKREVYFEFMRELTHQRKKNICGISKVIIDICETKVVSARTASIIRSIVVPSALLLEIKEYN
jgi:hypothetical protein